MADAIGLIKAGLKARKAFRRWRERVRARKQTEETSERIELKEKKDVKILDFIAGLRTSTKSGVAGLVVPAVAMVPFYDEAATYMQQACESGEGPLPFVIGGAVTWITMYVSARISKTPAKPGKF